jgi:hypothetical protein
MIEGLLLMEQTLDTHPISAVIPAANPLLEQQHPPHLRKTILRTQPVEIHS